MAANRPKRLRCGIYTRKSSEEGLDQTFNSLDAQREACEAYIKSQAGEGWQLVRTRYDDGGISGGTLDRPALQQLLADIKACKVDTVVVYKVDRLTRSLADFAKIVEVFDGQGVSFVSVTQQFNTTTSMGRLTLNMLLSFAQFEREVTGERIRDKIAASKQRGMWMGGYVPLGYEAKDRSLVINEIEAETVRTIFRLYLQHGNVRQVKDHADLLGLMTKVRQAADGKMRGGRPLSRGYIYKLLKNPLYIGRIAHKGTIHDGRHAAIVDTKTWEAVQASLTGNAHARRSGSQAAEPSLLAGLLYDERGSRLSPSHAVKTGKRYRYYVSRALIAEGGSDYDRNGLRIPAHEIETLVIEALERLLLSRTRLFDLLQLDGASPGHIHRTAMAGRHVAGNLTNRDGGEMMATLRTMLDRVTIAAGKVLVAISASGLSNALGVDPVANLQDMALGDPRRYTITIFAKLTRCGRASRLIITDDDIETVRAPDRTLVRILGRAHKWIDMLTKGQVQGAEDIAQTEGLTRSYVTRVLRLAFLAPDITEAILDGRQPPDLNAERLVRDSKLPLGWADQRRLLGFTQP